eukprot:1158514-Pelagomonas_calceolata.AAC.6
MQQPPKDSTGPCLEHASYPQPKLTAKAQPRLSISAAEAWRAHWQRVLLLRWMYKSRGCASARARQLPAGGHRHWVDTWVVTCALSIC